MKCPYCDTDVTTKFGHYARHVEECPERRNTPVGADQTPVGADQTPVGEPPRWRHERPRLALGGNVVAWRRG